ncbi:hypothetical protein C2G38_2252459 [Gigaspora rosea]|uniref:Protein kinase domain-containing protein n=1 Tax=Gigaspora rosea TaxID=44941 RepID=A0A397UBL9_9GLOM|nr:hypothetical protein C2G38_2252459 [Gigaspora rosea]
MDDALTLSREINRLFDFNQDEQFRLRKYFADNVKKIDVVVAFLTDFKTDDEKRGYLKSFISTHAKHRPKNTAEELRAQLEALKLDEVSDLLLESEIKRRKREKEYRETVNIGLKARPPSSGAKPSTFFTTQITNPILNGRPLELTGPPINIYNRVFTKFLEDFNSIELEVPPDTLEWVMDIISASADKYFIEDGRMNNMREILSKIFGTIVLTSYAKGCSCDGLLTAKVGLLDAYIGIIEGENEVGSGETDPSLKAAIYYRDYWSQTVVEQIRDCCCVPSFIITITGPWICVLGGIFLNRVVVQPLTDMIPLTINVRNEDQVEQRYFPYLRSFKLDDKNVNFIYIEELEDNRISSIWKARTTNMENNYDIVVKFVKNYNITAHKICSGKGYAPKILYQSPIDEFLALGRYWMIIMEFVGISLDRKLDQRDIRPSNLIYNDVKLAIELLHSNNYVFADLRLPNILVYDENERQRAKLIDFDWCGRHKVDKYPSSLNMSIQWPTNVKPGTFLMKEHDIYWLGKLQERLSTLTDGFQPTDGFITLMRCLNPRLTSKITGLESEKAELKSRTDTTAENAELKTIVVRLKQDSR